MAAGKGDKPRNCFSDKFKNNYAKISWNKRRRKKSRCNYRGKIITYYK